ncbi:papain family cysteine protease (macronuclear) [Tetrahymena thermophila SB210]|uniref:Papain family cysteine protease n=1 Tax=Tetrahymena thermophila (strain SB210) TaxID=312017 RepID=W7XCY4_TETTS|nr:papain family cysteine protease [Tetrahymena thermophila SB210]EWS74453.1 papain family cysteine protease [Tetrahymena thermophila SB210]|eukprot:XP_012653030.1 papain family cysteine protease [Tetrahymena thermophila SB210]
MNKLLLVLTGVLALGSTLYLLSNQSSNLRLNIENDITIQWKLFKSRFNKRYADPITESYRLQVFASNYLRVLSDVTGTFGVTQFFDLTEEEFAATYLTLRVQRNVNATVSSPSTPKGQYDVNWVTRGKVSAVKDQGQCGSCWAFSTTGSVESALIIAGYANQTIDLSEQQLVDCSATNYGCGGGWMDNAFEYIEESPLTTNSNYPYVAVDQACNSTEIYGVLYSLSNYTDVESGNTVQLKQYLQQQPLSIAVDASYWYLYNSGIFSNCGQNLNHGVLLVGFNSTEGSWLVKNSWGTSWGEQGYIRLADGNTCGLANAASYPTVVPPITSY